MDIWYILLIIAGIIVATSYGVYCIFVFLNPACHKCDKDIYAAGSYYYKKVHGNATGRKRCLMCPPRKNDSNWMKYYCIKQNFKKDQDVKNMPKTYDKSRPLIKRLNGEVEAIKFFKIINFINRSITFEYEINNQTQQANNKNIGIYMIKNKYTNKLYIGQSINIHKRWEQHLANEKNDGFHINLNRRDFEFSILINCAKSDLNFIEAFFIKKYKTLAPHGYNLTNGNYSHLSVERRAILLGTF